MPGSTECSAKQVVTSGQIPELLQAVFESGVLDWEMREHVLDESNIGDLWLFLRSISCVSAVWRSIAHGTPKLWRNLFSCEMTYSSEPFRSSLYGNFRDMRKIRYSTQFCLKRSGRMPLRVLARGTEYALRLFEFLDEDDLGRIQECRILDPWNDCHWLADKPDYAVPRLRNTLVTTSLPQLRKFTLTSDDLDVSTFISMIENFPSLTTLIAGSYAFAFGDFPPPEPAGPISFPSLREVYISSFAITDVAITDVAILFKYLSAPALEILRIFLFDEVRWETSPDTLTSLFLPSTWDFLRVLSVGGAFQVDEIEALLLSASNLEVLEVYCFNYCDDDDHVVTCEDMLELLMVGPETSCCHNLDILRFVTLYPDNKPTLHRLLDSRSTFDSCRKLNEVSIHERAWQCWSSHDLSEFDGKVTVREWEPRDSDLPLNERQLWQER